MLGWLTALPNSSTFLFYHRADVVYTDVLGSLVSVFAVLLPTGDLLGIL